MSYESTARKASYKQESIQIEEVPLTKTQPRIVPTSQHPTIMSSLSLSPLVFVCSGSVLFIPRGLGVSCFVGLLVPANSF